MNDPGRPPGPQPEPDHDTVAGLYLATFAPRLDAYNRWGTNHYYLAKDHDPECPRESGCGCPWSPLTPAVILTAFRDRHPVGAYFPAADDTTHVAVVDLDRDDDGLDVAAELVHVFAGYGAAAYVEPSRARRAHVWLVGERMPATLWTFALLAACREAGYPATTPGELAKLHNIEVRPDGHRGPNGLGYACRLPGMHNPKDGKRRNLIAPGGVDMGPKVRDWLLGIELVPAESVVGLAERHVPPAPPKPVSRFHRQRVNKPDLTATEVLVGLYGVVNAGPGRFVRCPIHDDRRASMSVAKDDRRVFCHAASCVVNNNGKGLWPRELALLRRGAA